MPEATQQCSGPWHNHAGKYEQRPISEFSISPRTGKPYKTCDRCRAGHQESHKRIQAAKKGTPVVQVAASMPTADVESAYPVAPTHGSGRQFKWEVTIIQARVVTVYAKDYLDAGVEAGEGEVLNVRRLD